MMHQLTVRGVSSELNRRLTALSHARGQSVNALVLELLQKAAGLREKKERLLRYATWTPEDLTQAQASLREQRIIDERLWR